jgi:hypothetical protein
MKDQAHARRPGGETGRSSNEPLSAWNTRLIEVITDCEDDIKRYRDIIEEINGVRDWNRATLACCMQNELAHRHLTLFTALRIVGARFDSACESAGAGNHSLARATVEIRQHIRSLSVMMRAMFKRMEQGLIQSSRCWDYSGSLLARLTERRLRAAMDDAIPSLQEQFSCTLATTLMAAIEPAMKSVQDRLSLRPELPLNMKAFAGTMLGLKCSGGNGASVGLTDLASDISQILKIPRTICLSA